MFYLQGNDFYLLFLEIKLFSQIPFIREVQLQFLCTREYFYTFSYILIFTILFITNSIQDQFYV